MIARPVVSRRSLAAILAAATLAATACTASPAAVGTGGEIASFTIGNNTQITTLDPASPSVATNIMDLVDPPLAAFRSDGSLVPELASRVTTTADRITFDLRGDARFADGTAVTPDDVVFSLKRMISTPTNASSFKAIKDISAQGPATVVISLGVPDATVLANLLVYSQVLEKKQVLAAGNKFGTAAAPPVSAGPYKVASFTTSGITLVRNESYRGTAPKIDSIRFVYLPDENAAQLAMRSGSVNLYWDTTAAQIKAWSAVPGATATTVPSINVTFLGLDVRHAPFDDVHVRRAIAYAIDRRGLAAAVYGGHAEPLRSLLSAPQLASVSSKDAAERFLDTLPAYGFDMAKARAELARSGHPNGFAVSVVVPPFAVYGDALLENLQQNLKPLGVSIDIKHEPYDQWLAGLSASPDHGMQLWQYAAAAPQPNNTVPEFVGSSPAATPGNTANYAPAALDGPISTLLTSSSATEQFTATKAILTAVANDVPYVPLFNPDFLVVTSRGFALSKTADSEDVFSDRLAYDITATP